MRLQRDQAVRGGLGVPIRQTALYEAPSALNVAANQGDALGPFEYVFKDRYVLYGPMGTPRMANHTTAVAQASVCSLKWPSTKSSIWNSTAANLSDSRSGLWYAFSSMEEKHESVACHDCRCRRIL